MNRAELLVWSAERDLFQRRLLQTWRQGVLHGERLHADDYSRGFAAGIAYVKDIEHGLHHAIARSGGAARWFVHGKRVTRAEAGSHNCDRCYQGGPAPPWLRFARPSAHPGYVGR